MRNIDVHHLRRTSIPLPSNTVLLPNCSRLADVADTPVLFSLAQTPSSLTLHATALASSSLLSWVTCDLTPHLASPADRPTGLAIDGAALDPVTVALRGGALLSVDVESAAVELVGAVADDDGDDARGGVLALAKSPDGALVVVVSPVKIIVMTASWDPVGEVEVLRPGGGDCVAVSAHVSWRGDGGYFAVVMRDAGGGAYARVVDRDVQGVERVEVEEVVRSAADLGAMGGVVAWQPREGGVVCLAGPGAGVSVFERNGLRHMRNDFRLQGGEGVPNILEWSCDSLLLAVARVERPSEVDVYIRSNYRWYRKQCLVAAGEKGRIVDVRWDAENRNLVHVVSELGEVTSFMLRTSHVGAVVGGRGRVAVVDGNSVLFTDLTQALIPPPMSHSVLRASGAVTALAFKKNSDLVCALLSSSQFEILSVGGSSKASRGVWQVDNQDLLRFPVLLSEDRILAVETVATDGGEESLVTWNLSDGGGMAQRESHCRLPGKVMSLSLSDSNVLVTALSSGIIARISADEDGMTQIISRIKGTTAASRAIAIEEIEVVSRELVLVRDDTGCLAAVDVLTESALVLTLECTSYCVSGRYLVYTTRSHTLQCVSLSGSSGSLLGTLLPDGDWGKSSEFTPTSTGLVRPIDRGSLIVCALPGDVRIVLQAPRGNLETVAPRPLILAEVWRLAKAREYGAAFRLSRQQRIDMNIMVEADPGEFLRNIDRLIDEVPIPSHLSVFLTYLRADDVPRLNAVCEAVVDAIDRIRDSGKAAKFTSTVLTALVRRQPPRFDDALKRIQRAYSRSEKEGASALDFLLVLSKDEETLYHEALGTYDIKLALMVAKASQLDPVEYSNEMRQFQSMDENHRRHSIDMKLERYNLALEHLHACGPSERDACLELAREHKLFPTAMTLFAKDVAAMAHLRHWYARFLVSENRHAEAAVMYTANQQLDLAADAYRDAGMWRLALSSYRAHSDCTPEHTWLTFADSVADGLSEAGLARDAATVRWNMLQDSEGAINCLAEAQEWLAAFEIVAASGWGRDRVISDLLDAAKVHVADLLESATKLRERTARLVAVRETKERMRSALGTPGGGGARGDADSDAFTASTSGSSLGSYGSDMTFASSTATAQTKTSLYHSIGRGEGGIKEAKAAERRKTKASRKRVRTGHPREEDALVLTLKRLVPNEFLRSRLRETLTALAHGGSEAREVAVDLVVAIENVMNRCRELPDDILSADAVQGALEDQSWYLPVYASL